MVSIAKNAVEAFKLLKLEDMPIAVNLSLEKPSGLKRLNDKIVACCMIKKAREIGPFYTDKNGQSCEAGSFVMGLSDIPDAYESGAYGAALKICKTPKVMQRIYRELPIIDKGYAHYISVAPLDQADFEPDIVVVTCTTTWKAYTLLRAYTYNSGKTWKGESSPAPGCSWMFAYPYVRGEINIVIPSGGMFRTHAMRENELIIVIPIEQLNGVVQGLEEMPLILPHHRPGGEKVRNRIRKKLGLKG